MLSVAVAPSSTAQQRAEPLENAQQAPSKQDQNKTNGKTPESNKPQQPTPPSNISIQGPVAITQEPDPEKQKREADQKAQTHFENGIRIGTIFFAGIAAAAAILAWRSNRRSALAAENQVILLKNQITEDKLEFAEQGRIAQESLAEVRKTAESSQKSAEASEKAIQVARQTLALTNRAYLNPDDWRCNITRGEVRNRIDISFEFKNSGKFPGTIELITVYQPPRNATVRQTIMVYPNAESYRVKVADELTETEILSFANPGWLITRSVQGTVRYHDGFVIRERDFHRLVWINQDEMPTYPIPDSSLNNEREVKDENENG